MSGIERLREQVDRCKGWAQQVSNDLSDIADQIEREHNVSDREEHDAAAWVREHGGLDEVRRRWECLSYYADPVPRVCMERRLARRQRQIDECHAALRRRLDAIARLASENDALSLECAQMRPRLMPDGMCWPVFEDGEPVRIGDDVSRHGWDFEVKVIALYRDGSFSLNFWAYAKDERVRRPAPKVLDADGVEIRVGDVLYRKSDGHMVKVAEVYEKTFTDADDYVRPGDGFTHRAPVFAADVRPLHEGEHVYHVETGAELVVKELPKPGEYQAVVVFAPPASHLTSFDPDQLTHERPDSWERIEEDAMLSPHSYICACGKHDDAMPKSVQMSIDLVRRAKALADRERGE